jgi:two-component system, cell cycle sensor histidine kinase and response regulator CckA
MPETEVPHVKETIVLTEDYDAVRKVIARMLRLYGYKVLETCCGDEALLALEEHDGPVHMVLTDLGLPLMSGFELSRRVRSTRPKIKVLYMSGYTEDQDELRCVLDNAANYIQKPFTIEELAGKVREVLNKEVR